jgi:hypothetical protein
MTAILALFAPYVTLPSVLAVYQPDFALINIFTVAVIAAAGVACAVTLRKKGGKTA